MPRKGQGLCNTKPKVAEPEPPRGRRRRQPMPTTIPLGALEVFYAPDTPFAEAEGVPKHPRIIPPYKRGLQQNTIARDARMESAMLEGRIARNRAQRAAEINRRMDMPESFRRGLASNLAELRREPTHDLSLINTLAKLGKNSLKYGAPPYYHEGVYKDYMRGVTRPRNVSIAGPLARPILDSEYLPVLEPAYLPVSESKIDMGMYDDADFTGMGMRRRAQLIQIKRGKHLVPPPVRGSGLLFSREPGGTFGPPIDIEDLMTPHEWNRARRETLEGMAEKYNVPFEQIREIQMRQRQIIREFMFEEQARLDEEAARQAREQEENARIQAARDVLQRVMADAAHADEIMDERDRVVAHQQNKLKNKHQRQEKPVSYKMKGRKGRGLDDPVE